MGSARALMAVCALLAGAAAPARGKLRYLDAVKDRSLDRVLLGIGADRAHRQVIGGPKVPYSNNARWANATTVNVLEANTASMAPLAHGVMQGAGTHMLLGGAVLDQAGRRVFAVMRSRADDWQGTPNKAAGECPRCDCCSRWSHG